MAVDGCFACQRDVIACITVIHAHIGKGGSCGLIATEGSTLTVGIKCAVEVGIDEIAIDIDLLAMPANTSTGIPSVGIMLFVHLGRQAMVARSEQCAHRSIIVERGIKRSVGAEYGGAPMVRQAHGQGCTLQIVGNRS